MCKLRLLGSCSSCGPGKSMEALKKLDAQKGIFGGNCTILECARINRVQYCTRDCNSFPCENFRLGPYPFAGGFLDMQERRRRERPPAFDHNGRLIKVPSEYWKQLGKKDSDNLLNLTLFSTHSSGGLLFHHLNEDVLVDLDNCCLRRFHEGRWKRTDDPLLELITLLYLNNVDSFHPLGKDIVSPRDLRAAYYFQGSHALKLGPLLERYGNDVDSFKTAAEYLEGKPIDMADTAYALLPFPRVPLYYLFWIGDKEFKPDITVLFDRSIEDHFSASAIWGLVNLVSIALLRGFEIGGI
ncbi:MAG: DUF3786 domain-containing protein [Thermodesulfobacteriota bacterium]|nr:DUF3786 domain-containing protein [Thermodesulfobacteriota bacterium]